MKKNEK